MKNQGLDGIGKTLSDKNLRYYAESEKILT